MQNTVYWISCGGLTVFLVGVLLLAGRADAAIVYQQPITTFTGGTEVAPGFTGILIGTGIDAPLGLQSAGISAVSSTTRSLGFTLYCRVGSTWASGSCPEFIDQSVDFGYASITSAPATYQIGVVEGQTVPILPTRYYFFSLISGGGTGNVALIGTSTPNQCAIGCADVGSGTLSPINPYLVLVGNDYLSSVSATSSRILQQVLPQNGTTTSSTSVLFQYSWYNNPADGDFDKVQVEITDATIAYQYMPLQSDILLSGYATTTQTYLGLNAGHLHIWRACMYNTETTEKRCGPFYSFNVISASAPQTLIPVPDVNEGNATSSLSQALSDFINVPNLLATRYPFSLFYNVANLLVSLQASSTQDVSDVVLDYGSLDIATATKNILPAQFTVFGTSTISHFVPQPVIDAWRLLMASVLWMSFAALVFFTVKRGFV